MKKFINAKIYKHEDATEILVEDGKFKAIGKDLDEADEVIDLGGRLVLPPYATLSAMEHNIFERKQTVPILI